jgi:raffinose/stachyose/melibiose transport system substrate-binding protein
MKIKTVLKQRTKTILCMSVVFLLILTAACAPQQQPSDTTAQPATTGQQPSEPQEIDLTLHTWRNDVNKMFTTPESYPKELKDKGINVECTFISGDKYEQTMKANWSAGMAADVMTIQMGSQFLESIPYLRELTPLINKHLEPDWKEKYFKPQSFAGIDDLADGYYCLPIGIGIQYFIIANQDMFNEYGLELPKTYEDLKSVSKVFRDNGIVPLSWGFKEPDQSVTLLRCIVSDFDPKAWEGLEYTGATKFTDEIPKKAIGIMKEMLDTGILNENFVAMIPADAQDGFYQGKAAMAIHGGWMLGIYTNDKYEEWLKGFEMKIIPLVDFNGDGKPAPLAAGPNVAFSIPTTTADDKLDAAFEVVKCCTTGEGARFLHDNLMILPGTLKDYDPDIVRLLSPHEVEPVKSHIATLDEFMANSIPPYRIFNPIVKSETFVALGEVLSNQKSIDEAVAILEEKVKDSREQYNYFK